MSRIGKLPIEIPAGVEVKIDGNTVTAKGPLGLETVTIRPELKVEQQDNKVVVTRLNDDRKSRSLHGLSRTLVANAINGVKTGFEKRLENFPDSTHVIFVESEVDGRNKLVNWFKKNGYKTEMKAPSEGELRKWIAKLCKDEGKQIYENAAEYFIGAVGLDMLLIKNELEKVFSYCGDRDEITVDDIRAICVNEADDTLYAMIDAIGNRNRMDALKLYRDLLALKLEPLFILSQLSRNVRKMLEVSELINAGKTPDEIARLVSLWEQEGDSK